MIYVLWLWGAGRGAGQLTTSLAGAFPDREAREGALSSMSRAFVGGLHHACQAVLHPLESIQLLAGPQQDPWEAPVGDGAAQKATEEEDDEEPGRLHQVRMHPSPVVASFLGRALLHYTIRFADLC